MPYLNYFIYVYTFLNIFLKDISKYVQSFFFVDKYYVFTCEKIPQILSSFKIFEFLTFQVEQLLTGHEDSHGNINYEEFVRTVMNG